MAATIEDWTRTAQAHLRRAKVQSHSDPRHLLVSVEPDSAGRCGVLVVDHDRDEG